jgi:hypothetical protein
MTVQSTTTTHARVRRGLLLSAAAILLAGIACWAVLTFAGGSTGERLSTHPTSAVTPQALTPAERRAYVLKMTAIGFKSLAEMYGARYIERPVSSADSRRAQGRKQRRRVKAITALTNEQLAAAYGTGRP